ncbi:MAG: hypothetical protein ACP5OP_01835 [Leptospirillia bacterium]
MTTENHGPEDSLGRLPWRTGAPGPWVLRLFGGAPRGATLWVTRAMLVLAFLSLGLFTVTRLLLIHWVFLVPASLGSLFLLGALYVLLEMRRPPLAVLEIRPNEVSYRTASEGEILLPLEKVVLGESDVSFFDLVRLDTGEIFAHISRESVRDVSGFETIRRYLALSPASRPPLPSSSGSSRKRSYRWFILGWAAIILLMVLWALYENHAAPRSYEPFSNP